MLICYMQTPLFHPFAPCSAVRSHWEMLLERRSRDELEEILQERLEYIRARRKAGEADN